MSDKIIKLDDRHIVAADSTESLALPSPSLMYHSLRTRLKRWLIKNRLALSGREVACPIRATDDLQQAWKLIKGLRTETEAAVQNVKIEKGICKNSIDEHGRLYPAAFEAVMSRAQEVVSANIGKFSPPHGNWIGALNPEVPLTGLPHHLVDNHETMMNALNDNPEGWLTAHEATWFDDDDDGPANTFYRQRYEGKVSPRLEAQMREAQEYFSWLSLRPGTRLACTPDGEPLEDYLTRYAQQHGSFLPIKGCYLRGQRTQVPTDQFPISEENLTSENIQQILAAYFSHWPMPLPGELSNALYRGDRHRLEQIFSQFDWSKPAKDLPIGKGDLLVFVSFLKPDRAKGYHLPEGLYSVEVARVIKTPKDEDPYELALHFTSEPELMDPMLAEKHQRITRLGRFRKGEKRNHFFKDGCLYITTSKTVELPRFAHETSTRSCTYSRNLTHYEGFNVDNSTRWESGRGCYPTFIFKVTKGAQGQLTE